MTDIQRTIDRITSANPVPFPDALPSSAMSATDLLARIDERSTTMSGTLTPVRPTEPGRPPRNNRGRLIAIGVAAVLILVIGIITMNVFTGGEQPVVEDPAPVTTPAPATTQAPATTVPESVDEAVSPLGPDAPPLEVVAALDGYWGTGDLAGGATLFHPDSPYFTFNVGSGVGPELWYRVAVGASIESECTLDIPTDLADYPATGVIVSCDDVITSSTGEVIGGGPVAFEVKDGWILDIFILPGYVGALEQRGGSDQFITDYRAWVQERFPDELDTLFDNGVLIVDNPAARAQHQELIPFFVADTGPRGDLALPADTPLLEVVRIFNERWDSGDIEGYEAIFHPLTGYPSGQDAPSSWFVAVTGSTGKRDCELVTDTQVRCIDVMSPGLLPGTTLDPVTTVWNGAAGWIWTIEFPDGPPPAFTDSGTAPGVEEYRDWVQANRPDQFDSLFAGGLTMRLDTQEIRDAHVAMIDDYLAAVGG